MIRRLLTAVLAAGLVLTGCTDGPDTPEETPETQAPPAASTTPPDGVDPADDAAATLAGAIAAGDVSSLPMQSQAAEAQAELETIYAGMDDALPQVTVGPITYPPGERAATATLQHTFDIALEPWTFETEATFKYVNNQWRLEWSPAVLHEDLTTDSRMRRIVTKPSRASINDKDGVALVEEMSLYEVGIDKANLDEAQWASSARQLAAALGMDEATFEGRVLRGGPKQFVIASTLRQSDIPSEVADVPGIYVREITATVGPSDGFAASQLGIVGNPTAEMIEQSEGRLTSEDVIGLSGLQSRYDDELGGVPGVRVELVPRTEESSFQTKVIFNQEESVGAPLTLSMDRDLQAKAENILGSQEGIASLVAIDIATGGIVAVADSAAAGTYPHSTFGRYAPGSTFKVVSALAMVRSGMTADSEVNCTSEHAVATYTFRNYPGYSRTGTISLADAIAYSCNTAFTRASESISGEELHSAAGSLGVGTDYDAGFRSYFGTVEPQNNIDRAASMIGQGNVTMSPMGMAAVAASVAKGETVIPWLVEGRQAESTAEPLTDAEAAELRTMMEATVSRGTGTMLQGVATGAKSGTAEWGPQGEQQTHAWMIAYDDQYAVSAFVEVGDSGGAVAAPLVRQFLS